MTKETLKEQILSEFDESWERFKSTFPQRDRLDVKWILMKALISEMIIRANKDFLSSSMDRIMAAQSVPSETAEMHTSNQCTACLHNRGCCCPAISDSEASGHTKTSSDMPEEAILEMVCKGCGAFYTHDIDCLVAGNRLSERPEGVTDAASLIPEIEKMKLKPENGKVIWVPDVDQSVGYVEGRNEALNLVIKLIQSRTSDDRGEQSANASVTPKKHKHFTLTEKALCISCKAISEERSDSSVAN